MADFVVERILSTPSNFQKELHWMMDEMQSYIGEFDNSKYKFTWIMRKPLMHDILMNMPGLVEHIEFYSDKIFGIDVIFESYCPGVDVYTVRLKAMNRTSHERPVFIPTAYNLMNTFNEAVYDYMRKDANALKAAFERNLMTINPMIVKTDKEISELLNFNVKDSIKKVIFNEPATIVYWKDGTRTVVKCDENDTYSKETGLAMCIVKKITGNKGNYNDVFRKWIPKDIVVDKSKNKIDKSKNKIAELRIMVNQLSSYCRGRSCVKCVLGKLPSFHTISAICTGSGMTDEELLDDEKLIREKYKRISKSKV